MCKQQNLQPFFHNNLCVALYLEGIIRNKPALEGNWKGKNTCRLMKKISHFQVQYRICVVKGLCYFDHCTALQVANPLPLHKASSSTQEAPSTLQQLPILMFRSIFSMSLPPRKASTVLHTNTVLLIFTWCQQL